MPVTDSVVTVTDDTFADMVLTADRPVIVDFWADWCPPCVAISRVLTELADEMGDRVVVSKVNADENPNTILKYGIRALPTLLIFHRGEVVGSIIGAVPKTTLRRALSEHIDL